LTLNRSVYAGGPITGLSCDEAIEARDRLERLLPDWVQLLSPMRNKEHLKGETVLHSLGYNRDTFETAAQHLATSKGIVARDTFDFKRAGIMIADFTRGKDRASIGTVCEMGIAYALGKPIIVVLPTADNVHNHAFVLELASYVVKSIDEAVELTGMVLGPPPPEHCEEGF
jgi:nucleoside 2-deoxyribosyltransferase